MCKILEFPKKEKISGDIIEHYVVLIEKLGVLNFRQELILENINSNKLFNGCHSPVGELPENIYKLLLSFNNFPSLENWVILKDKFIFGRTRACDIVSIYYPEYLDKNNETIYPPIEVFMSCFMDFREKCIQENAKYLGIYKMEIEEIEKKHPSIKKILVME